MIRPGPLSANGYPLPRCWIEEEPLKSWPDVEEQLDTVRECGSNRLRIGGGTYWLSQAFLYFKVLPGSTGLCRPYDERY